jgi:hypothetical protein
MKEPSPDVKPATQCGSLITGLSNRSLFTGITSGKEVFKISGKPQLRADLIDTIFLNPSRVKCSLSFIIFTTSLNRR